MDNLLPHATPTDGLGQRNACAEADAFVSPSAAALRPTCAAFAYRRSVAPVCRNVTRKLPIGSGCVHLRIAQNFTFRQCENFVSREHDPSRTLLVCHQYEQEFLWFHNRRIAIM